MRILLVRHGQSDGNANPFLYSVKGDWGTNINETGWRQGDATGLFLTHEYYPETHTETCPLVMVSGYVRTQETLAAIWNHLSEIFPGDHKIYEDPRLIEKFLGATSHLAHSKLSLRYLWDKAAFSLSKLVHRQSPFTSRGFFGDSDKDIWIAFKSILDGTLTRDIAEDKDDFLMVTHGRVIDIALMIGGHLRLRDMDKLLKIGNGDVVEIKGEPKNWTFRKIWDGEKMERCNLDALNGLKPFSIKDLPPIPDFLKFAP